MEQIPIEKAAIDSRVQLISNNIRYRGTVVHLDSEEGKITLKDVEMIKEEESTPAFGVLTFFGKNIEDVKFLDEEAVMSKMDPNYLLMKPFRKPMHLRGQYIPSDEEILQINRPKMNAASGDSEDLEGAALASTMDSEIIDKIDENFEKAIALLKDQTILSISAEGVLLSRQGELCWLVIGFQNEIFLFDMISLGDEAYSKGLSNILQSMAIVKIIHDCRFLSDYLFHKHQIFLQNVWDTQVARIVIFKQTHFGDLPEYVESLPKILQDFLGVDPNTFPFLWYREDFLEKDQADTWRPRPLAIELQKVLEGQVKYLYDLRNALAEKLSKEMIVGTETYLKTVRDARTSDIGKLMRGKKFVPLEFYKKANAEREWYAKFDEKTPINPITGARECVGRLNYWKLRFSRDAWHGVKEQNGSKCVEEEEHYDEEEVEPEPELD